jgi:hypothetical protein
MVVEVLVMKINTYHMLIKYVNEQGENKQIRRNKLSRVAVARYTEYFKNKYKDVEFEIIEDF